MDAVNDGSRGKALGAAPRRDRGVKAPRHGSAADSNGDDLAPLAGGGIVHPENGAVFPMSKGSRAGGGVVVVWGGIEGENLPAGAAVDLDFQLVKEFGVALPALAELDAARSSAGRDFWT
jgi:hypothetical protein